MARTSKTLSNKNKKKPLKKKSSNLINSKNGKNLLFSLLSAKNVVVALAILVIGTTGLVLLNRSSAAEQWALLWSDEFNGSQLDTSKWGVYYNTYGDGNNEEACLTPNNVTVSGGSLFIAQKKESVVCKGKTNANNFSSGFISTRSIGSNSSSAQPGGKYFPKYARYEMRAKLPHGQGLWPAFWLRHKNGSSIAEVDVLEYFHSQVPGKTTGTIHLDNVKNVTKKTTFFESPTRTPGWHTWAVEIQPDSKDSTKAHFDFLLDGEVYLSVTPTQQNWASAVDVNTMFDIAVNVAVGGNYAGHPDDQLGWSRYLNACLKPYKGPQPCDSSGILRAEFPTTMEVDYVRVYTKQKVNDPVPETNPTDPPTDTNETKLATPSNLMAETFEGKISLKWDVVPGADNYTVRWNDGNGWKYSNNPGLQNPVTNEYEIANLKSGTIYSISVAARDKTKALEGSEYSQAITAKTKEVTKPAPTPTPTPTPTPDPIPTPPTADTQPPSVPANLSRSLRADWGRGKYVMDLKWSPSVDNSGTVASYQITRNGAVLGTTANTSFTDGLSLKAGTLYTYTVTAKDPSNNTSSPASITAKARCFWFVCSLE